GKLNKMFNFYRGGSKIQMYRNALLHSKYIQKVITEENESIWIAQRDGRTKDGNDKTQVSLIKMLTMGKDNPFAALKELHIVPVTISYEYEPCDARKVQERYLIQTTGTYKKQEGEDFDSVLKGITNFKGQIHVAFGTELTPVIEACEKNQADFNTLTGTVATEIDKQVYRDYKLRAVNYIAADMLNDTYTYLNKNYTQKEYARFIEFVEQKTALLKGEKDMLRTEFLKLYATPLFNQLYNH
ncbi:MAG: acyltransferase, partial [Candidatus Zixiibacteriota bacterium]